MIDKEIGKISFDNGIEISPETMFVDIASILDLNKPFTECKERGENKNISLGIVRFFEVEFCVRLYFRNDKLVMVSLGRYDKTEKSWADWSLEKEERNKQLDEQFLEEIFGHKPPYEFAWGRVASVLDLKTGGADIIITYKD